MLERKIELCCLHVHFLFYPPTYIPMACSNDCFILFMMFFATSITLAITLPIISLVVPVIARPFHC